jgi:hypothetical protein
MKKNHLKIILGLSIFLLWGCYPQESGYVNDYDIVGTNYDKEFQFSQHKTYALPDSIVSIGDQTLTGKVVFVDQKTADLILNQIRANLNQLGWVEKDTSVADIILLPSAFKNTNVYYYYDYAYWGWYYPGYYPGYGWGYPGYGYPYPVASSYETGTLFMQMTYRKGIEASSVPVVWTGIINGLLNVGSSSSVNSRITTTINQAFKQSPYLK